MLAVWVGTALAAEVTDIAPPLGGIGGLVAEGVTTSGALLEAGAVVGDRRVSRSTLSLGVELAPIRGLAVTFDLPFVPSLRYTYPGAPTMVVDPLTGQGIYRADGGADYEISAGGFGGAWIGLAAVPLSESYGKAQRATGRLDIAVRTPRPNKNVWTAVDGDRSPAPGGAALRIAAAFSADRGPTEPYLRAELQREFPVTLDIVDEQGTAWARAVTLRPASTIGADAGAEWTAFERDDLRIAADGWIGAGYRTWEDVASGIYLPNVLDSGRVIPVTASDTLFARAGLGADVHYGEHVRARAGATLGWTVPYQLEHLYDVYTSPGTVDVGWFLEVRGVLALRDE